VRHQQRDVSVQCHGVADLVLKHVEVVQAVRLIVVWGSVSRARRALCGGGQREGRGVLGDAVHVLREREAHIQAYGARTEGHGVLVPTEVVAFALGHPTAVAVAVAVGVVGVVLVTGRALFLRAVRIVSKTWGDKQKQKQDQKQKQNQMIMRKLKGGND
jgi:hypothetical protein